MYQGTTVEATVSRVVDGDTISVLLPESNIDGLRHTSNVNNQELSE